ncbi:DUF6221 family protein [Nocardia farcinica]|uniref:Uncharacterized protein n=1 Tax=Nocardia farcinica (strain IFM 10152) TaxID=247156 RepID=Q5YSH4_NOCFA|nr:DUF6221 family protein [Nocardia farcinica]BAD58867.1 hypothetical protein NFA_40190 [Nocardia farcinica IFM 10152]
MSNIEKFIEARLDEDEEWARGVAAAQQNASDSLVLFVRQWLPAGFGKKYPDPHPLPGDPRRELRQNDVLRELFERARPERWCRGHPGPWMSHGDYGPGYCDRPAEGDSLYVIAAIWSDHPDYQPEWATNLCRFLAWNEPHEQTP